MTCCLGRLWGLRPPGRLGGHRRPMERGVADKRESCIRQAASPCVPWEPNRSPKRLKIVHSISLCSTECSGGCETRMQEHPRGGQKQKSENDMGPALGHGSWSMRKNIQTMKIVHNIFLLHRMFTPLQLQLASPRSQQPQNPQDSSSSHHRSSYGCLDRGRFAGTAP